ncbi:MAG: hypothetical protein ACRCYU_14885 [Nocardioides sp.]
MSNLPTTRESLRARQRELTRGEGRAPARVVRAVERGVAVEQGRAIVSAAQVRAVEYVAHEGLQAVSHLSQLEAMHTRMSPHAAGRLQLIADLATASIADVVAETGRS